MSAAEGGYGYMLGPSVFNWVNHQFLHCRSVFELDYQNLLKLPKMWRLLMLVEKQIMVLSLVPEPTRRNIQHLKDYPVFQALFFDFRMLAVS